MNTTYFQVKKRSGEPYYSSGNKIVPLSKAYILQFPGLHGGFVWNRPVGLAVSAGDGQEKFLPVYDVTRRIQLALLGMVLAVGLLTAIASSRKSGTR
jgi:hypothetical protein